MKNNKKKIKTVIGCSLIAVAGITLFYQWRYSKLKSEDKVEVLVATRQIEENETLTLENTKLEQREKSSLNKMVIRDIDEINGAVAKETIYPNESININRIWSEKEFKEKNYRLVSIKCKKEKDVLVGYDVKPNDKVDILFFDKESVYSGTPFIKSCSVFDLKSAEGISYKDRVDDNFVPESALIWVEDSVAEDIYSKQELGGYFRFQLTKDRPIEKVESTN